MKPTFRMTRCMKFILIVLLFVCTIWLGSKALIHALDAFGLGPNVPNQNEKIEENLRGLESRKEF